MATWFTKGPIECKSWKRNNDNKSNLYLYYYLPETQVSSSRVLNSVRVEEYVAFINWIILT